MDQTRRYTPAEYLAFERSSPEKHEYFDGEIFAMAGASRQHVEVTDNVHYQLRRQLDGKDCQPYSSDLRIKFPTTGRYTYADVTVACPPLEFEDKELDTLLNPRVVIEVLSPSTERNDRGAKLRGYQQLPSVQEILLVAQNQARIEHLVRADDGWRLNIALGLEEAVELSSIGCRLALAQVYQGVELPAEPSVSLESPTREQ